MRFLFDANLSPSLCGSLGDLYPGSEHVIAHGIEGDDMLVWQHARDQGFAVVTKDNDFHGLSTTLGHPPKVIQIRLGNCLTVRVETLLRQRFHEISEFEASSESLLVLP